MNPTDKALAEVTDAIARHDAEGRSCMSPGYIELSQGADWWEDTAETIAMREAKVPAFDASIPERVQRMVEALADRYVALERARRERECA
jgi:hypothetical protein